MLYPYFTLNGRLFPSAQNCMRFGFGIFKCRALNSHCELKYSLFKLEHDRWLEYVIGRWIWSIVSFCFWLRVLNPCNTPNRIDFIRSFHWIRWHNILLSVSKWYRAIELNYSLHGHGYWWWWWRWKWMKWNCFSSASRTPIHAINVIHVKNWQYFLYE